MNVGQRSCRCESKLDSTDRQLETSSQAIGALDSTDYSLLAVYVGALDERRKLGAPLTRARLRVTESDLHRCTLALSQSAGNRVRRREHGARERERCTESVVREMKTFILFMKRTVATDRCCVVEDARKLDE